MPKGNPNPSPDTRFSTEREESFTEALTIRITPSMMTWLNSFGDRKSSIVRKALQMYKEHENRLE
jgi:hypothetical protein